MTGPGPRKRTKTSARSLERCRQLGWRAGVVERYNPHSLRTHDYLGFADILALDGQLGVLAIQSCSDQGGDLAKHLAKIEGDGRIYASLVDWLRHGNRFAFWAWGKRRSTEVTQKGERSRRVVWRCRVQAFGLEEDSERLVPL